jgi:hypothetical protein
VLYQLTALRGINSCYSSAKMFDCFSFMCLLPLLIFWIEKDMNSIVPECGRSAG